MTNEINPQRLNGPLIDPRSGRGSPDFLDFLYRLWARTGGSATNILTNNGIDHDQTLNFEANEHTNHTSVSINAGTGLTGGGTIASSRTISLSHLGLQSLTAPGADRIFFWDHSQTASKFLQVGNGLEINATTLRVPNFVAWSDFPTAPIIADASFSGAESQSASTQNGRYKRENNTVHFTIELTVSSLGTLSTGEQAAIINLPVTPAGIGAVTVNKASGLSLGTAGRNVTASVTSDGILLWLWDDTTGTTALTLSEFTASGSIELAGWYPV